MALGLNKILIAGSATNTPGAYWQLTTIAATTAVIIATNMNIGLAANTAFHTLVATATAFVAISPLTN